MIPLGLAVLVGVLDDEAEAGAADGVFGGAEDPDAGVVHLDDGVDALAGADEEGVDGLAGVGTGLPSRAMTWNLWPGRAMRRFSMAQALRR